MKTLNKLLIASTMVVTLGATSCNNKAKDNNVVAGLPYTYVELGDLKGSDCTVEFQCEGNFQTYWNNLETSDTAATHTFNAERENYPYFLIKGNITSLRFCNDNGSVLKEGNAKIKKIIFSNTIKNISEYACQNLHLYSVYLPASIETIGKNAFIFDKETAVICEPTDRPEGWDPHWCTYPILEKAATWGLSYCILKDYSMYSLSEGDDMIAIYYGNLFNKFIDNLKIPEYVKVGGHSFKVIAIRGFGAERDLVKTITIPKTIKYIDYSAFGHCARLNKVNFASKYGTLFIDSFAFNGCYDLEKIYLPNGLVGIPNSFFYRCEILREVRIPSSVQFVDENVFYSACYLFDLKIDLTDYKSKDKIAECNMKMLNGCEARSVTFKIASNLSESDFVEHGWPATSSEGEMSIAWVK